MRKFLLGLLFLTVVVVNTFICLVVVSTATGDTNKLLTFYKAQRQANKASANAEIAAQTPQKDEITISFAGDCTLGSFKGSDNQFGRYYLQYGAGYFFKNVAAVFKEDDITFVNLEGPLTAHPQEAEKQYSIRGEPWYVDILNEGSVEVCNLSNNHIMDCGQIGVNDTISLLKQNGIGISGENYISVQKVNDITVCLLGYQAWENSEYLRNQITQDIKTCRDSYKADIVCVEFHWGEERKYYPNRTQMDLGHFAVDAGADCVVGAHPHVIQGIEKYHGKVIAYSLGNFCFGANNNPVDKDTFILRQTFKKDGTALKTEVLPCRISSREDTNDFCPALLTGAEADKVLSRIRQCSASFNETINFQLP